MAQPVNRFEFPKGVGSRQGLKSPVAVASFPKILEPDAKFGSPAYSVGLVFDPSDPAFKALESDILKAHGEAVKYAEENAPKTRDNKGNVKPLAVVDPPISVQLDRDKNPTGKMVVKFKLNAAFKDRKTGAERLRPLPVYNGKAQPWPKNVEVGGGSRLRVYYDVSPFYTAGIGVGVSLRMSAVVVVEARSYGPKIEVEDDCVLPEGGDALPEGVAGTPPTEAGGF